MTKDEAREFAYEIRHAVRLAQHGGDGITCLDGGGTMNKDWQAGPLALMEVDGPRVRVWGCPRIKGFTLDCPVEDANTWLVRQLTELYK